MASLVLQLHKEVSLEKLQATGFTPATPQVTKEVKARWKLLDNDKNAVTFCHTFMATSYVATGAPEFTKYRTAVRSATSGGRKTKTQICRLQVDR